MRKTALIGAVAALALGATVAVAQVGGNDEQPKPTQVAECADEQKQGGAFGACVSERASAFGRCVAEAAKTGEGNPTAACAELHPGNRDRGDDNGNGDDGDENGEEPNGNGEEPNGNGEEPNGNGEGNGNGEPAAAAQAGNPTEGVTRPPEQSGRDFGRQVSENARGNGNGADRNPTTGVTKPPEQSGRDFGGQVSENARGNRGGPNGD